MSNLEAVPVEESCSASRERGLEVLRARDVPLGGARAMRVRRTLPQRQRSLIGAWCFADHYGPHDVTRTPGMIVPPHPHTGLQTVSWLFSGEIEHRDSGGVHAYVRPGELNLMTAGAGICHSEVSTAATRLLHGVQLWVALPESDRDTTRGFDHFVPDSVTIPSGTVRVFLGNLEGITSPVYAFTPLLGAQLDIDAQADVTLTVHPGFEHGVLLDQGVVSVGGSALEIGDLACQSAGVATLRIANTGVEPARVLVLGGTPFTEEILMWWNFVGRSHEDIASYRELWESENARFGAVDGYAGTPARLPAPPLPTTRLKPRPAPGASDAR